MRNTVEGKGRIRAAPQKVLTRACPGGLISSLLRFSRRNFSTKNLFHLQNSHSFYRTFGTFSLKVSLLYERIFI